MKRLSTITGLLLILIYTATASAAKVYKWVDEEGVTHYDEQAPTGKDYQQITTSGAPPTDSVKAKKNLADSRKQQQLEKEKQLDFETQKKIRDEQARVRNENCKNAQANLKTLQQNARIRMIGEDGEFHYLSEEDKQKQMDTAQKIIDDNCGPINPE